MNAQITPIRQRPGDIIIVAFFLFNFFFITYLVDIEQLVIADPGSFSYPFWPPPAAVDVIHNYAQMHDPDILARPAWWRATIWIDVLLFGPFYAVAIYAYIRGRAWIRIPSIIYGSMIITNVLIILMEERFGSTPAPDFAWVFLTNLPWLVIPGYVIFRMWRDPFPFTRKLIAQAPPGRQASLQAIPATGDEGDPR